MYEALQLVGEGRGADLIRSAEWKKNQNGGELCVLGGRWVVNPSGGLESKGHPIGATGKDKTQIMQISSFWLFRQ